MRRFWWRRARKSSKVGGSRVRFVKDGEIETFHRPHPQKEAKRYQVRAARNFLERIGVDPK
ncbi:MAG: type II toxin-antitoxin system HicA family toxin [Ahrensia sp.]|nr:type II toxin-antitoxin system HicA family toxin [Ahrensia sp.]